MTPFDYVFVRQPSKFSEQLRCENGHKISTWTTEDLGAKLATYVLEEDKLYRIDGAGSTAAKTLCERSRTVRLHGICEKCVSADSEDLVAGFDRGVCRSVQAMATAHVTI